ncbi:MAG: TlpA disulfide reductase family protein [Nocardioides sp.]
MRRGLLAPLAALLLVLAACGGGSTDSSAYKEISLPAPDVVKIKKQSDVPDCPHVSTSSVSGGMPSITLGCLGGGRSVDMAGLRGPMIVNLFASWCSGCHEEMPHLAAYARSQSRVRVLGVDFLDTQPGAALQLAQRSDVAYPLVADPKGELDRASPLPKIQGLPWTVFVSADGSIAHIEAGTFTSEHEVAEAAQQYLGTGG